VIALLLAAGRGRAAPLQPLPNFSLERFNLDADGLGSLGLGSGLTLPAHSYRISAGLQFERDPLLLNLQGAPAGAVIRNRFTLGITAAFALNRWLEVAGQLNVVPNQSGSDLASVGFDQPGKAAFSEPFLSARAGLLRSEDGAPLDLAVQLGLGVPLASAQAFGRNDSPSLVPRVMVSRNVGTVLASLDVGMLLRTNVALPGGQRIGSQLDGGMALSSDLLQRLRAEVSLRFAQPFTKVPGGMELLAGVRYQALPRLEVFAIAGPGINSSPGTPAFRAMLGAAFTPEQPVRAAFVAAPSAVPPASAVVCPPAPPPPVVATREAGPCDPGQKHTPEQCPELDDDHDGIVNRMDECPLEPGPLATRGCPDRDGDGVPDKYDNCPDEPGPASNQGCPVKIKEMVVITAQQLEIKHKVYFDLGKTRVLPRSFALLDDVAKVIKAHPEMAAIIIEGHTDNTGNAQRNREISQARAEAVRDYLIKRGVTPNRLQAKGYGPDRPIAPNATAPGRATNRRVEFQLGKQQQPPPPSPSPSSVLPLPAPPPPVENP
jgi:outer membrane protein OmpA-like peptidoglycan-associated protein